jgi:flagellar motor protein MotB
VARDFLLSKGLDAKRFEVVSFGDTQTADELRRVDVIFRTD